MPRKRLSRCAPVLAAFPAGQAAQAGPCGHTLGEALQRHASARVSGRLSEGLESEPIAMRPGMGARDAGLWAARSRAFRPEPRRGSVCSCVPEAPEAAPFGLSFEARPAKGEAFAGKTGQASGFEPEEEAPAGLKPLKDRRLSACRARRGRVDPGSCASGRGSAAETGPSLPGPGGEARPAGTPAAVAPGKPGLLCPGHVGT